MMTVDLTKKRYSVLKRNFLNVLSILAVVVACAACSSATTTSPTPSTVLETVQPTEPTLLASVSPTPANGTAACESYFGFCVSANVSGDVTTTVNTGAGSSYGNNCLDWAAAGDTRILELPIVLSAGENKLTVALTRIGAYTGPGTYTLAASTTSGNPDSFPAIEVAGRTFSNGEGSTAVVTIAADGSGSIRAAGLVELASILVAKPDPNARIDFTMQWICQNEQ